MSNLLDSDTILKYGTNPNAVADFERFVQSHIEIHDKYNFSMVKLKSLHLKLVLLMTFTIFILQQMPILFFMK